MNILFIIKLKTLALIHWSDRFLPIMLAIEFIMVSIFWAHIPNLLSTYVILVYYILRYTPNDIQLQIEVSVLLLCWN
jgi:hypothetical protein